MGWLRFVGALALVGSLLVGGADAQAVGDAVASQYVAVKKLTAAANFCVREEGRMQVERNEHYDAFLRANAKDPHAPTIGEMSDTRAQTRLEDEALAQKRDECVPLLDEIADSVRELRRTCAAYLATGTTNDRPTPLPETLPSNICGIARGIDKLGSGN